MLQEFYIFVLFYFTKLYLLLLDIDNRKALTSIRVNKLKILENTVFFVFFFWWINKAAIYVAKVILIEKNKYGMQIAYKYLA